jgi:predicted nuclease of predicted toxin-antitoxin system
MRTLASELGAFAERLTEAPRIYVDANLPAGLVRFMRERLGWSVFYVMEEDALRRAPDAAHFRLAAKLRRTLLTLDQDFLDDVRFPPAECSGLLVLSASHEEQFERLLARVDRELFQKSSDARARGTDAARLQLRGRKLHLHADWTGDIESHTQQPRAGREVEQP